MGRLAALLMTLVLVALAALIALNWPALNVVVPVNLGAVQLEVPMGAAAAWGLALVAFLFMAAQLGFVLSSWRRTRRADQEIVRLRALAESAETSRFEELRQLMLTEFRRMHTRLGPEQASELVVGEPFAAVASPARSGFFSKRTGA